MNSLPRVCVENEAKINSLRPDGLNPSWPKFPCMEYSTRSWRSLKSTKTWRKGLIVIFVKVRFLNWINWKRLLFRVDFCCLFGNQSSDWLSVDMGLLLYSLVLSLSFILSYLHFTSYIYMSLVLLFSIQQIRFTVPFSWLCFWRKVYARPTWIIVAWLLSHLPRRIPPVTTRLCCLETLLFADSKKGLEKKIPTWTLFRNMSFWKCENENPYKICMIKKT